MVKSSEWAQCCGNVSPLLSLIFTERAVYNLDSSYCRYIEECGGRKWPLSPPTFFLLFITAISRSSWAAPGVLLLHRVAAILKCEISTEWHNILMQAECLIQFSKGHTLLFVCESTPMGYLQFFSTASHRIIKFSR